MALISRADIPLLIEILGRFTPRSNKLYYTAQNILAGRLEEAVIVTDQWPHPGVLMMRHEQSINPDKRWTLRPIIDIFCFSSTTTASYSFLQHHIDWSNEVLFSGIEEDVNHHLHQLVTEKSLPGKLLTLDEDKFLMFVASGERLPFPSLPPGYELGALTLSDIEQIDSEWTYGGSKDSKTYITFVINNFPAKGIRNMKTGKLGSYCLTERDGSIGMWYTDPQERGKHFGLIVLSSLTGHLQTVCHQKPFLVTSENNLAAIAVAKQVGYVCPDPKRFLYWTKFIPKK